MSCTGSETVENSQGFECRNMGNVLGKECEEEETLTRSVENVMREDGEGAVSSPAGSESDSEKEMSLDTDEDISWLIPVNSLESGEKKCECENCLKLFESYNSDKKCAKLILSCWKEFREYIKYVYDNTSLELLQRNETILFGDEERLHEIIQVLKLCDPYLLFQKIEDEVCSIIFEVRIRQLNLLKDDDNPALAQKFITGLIDEYVRFLYSAFQLNPAMENLLGCQLKRFGVTWEYLNKQLYRSLVYNHLDVQKNLLRLIEQLRKMLPVKDEMYHELVHKYLAFDNVMTQIGVKWKNVDPLFQEYSKLKSQESKKLHSILHVMKDFFSNKLCTPNEEESEKAHNEDDCPTADYPVQYCPICMTKWGCPCNECTVTHHMMAFEDILLGMESPLEGNTPPRSRSRSPLKQNESESMENRGEGDVGEEEVEEQQSCECFACTITPPDLMEFSTAFSQPTTKPNNHGEGFHLYPHIHGTTSDAENVSSFCFQHIYDSLQASSEPVYSHLYNLPSQTNSVDNQSQMNEALRTQLMEAIATNKVTPQVCQTSASSPPPPPPPPPPSQETTPLPKSSLPSLPSPTDSPPKNPVNLSQSFKKHTSVDKSVQSDPIPDQSKVNNSKAEGKKSESAKRTSRDMDTVDKSLLEKHQAKTKSNGCVISGLCGKCCLKHGSNCLKMSGCNKGSDKHLAAIARLGLSGNSGTRSSAKCAGGKEDHIHKTTKSHTCNKSKHQDGLKKSASKKSVEADDLSNLEDSCSEESNSTSVSTNKDPRHCDCCYCEVFGHGLPSVAPVSRNYQEMRERLRLRLNMKKSAKNKTGQSGQVTQQQQQQSNQKVAGSGTKPQVNGVVPKGEVKKAPPVPEDLDSLLKFIEGKKGECNDSKKAAKRARQKRKKQEAKAKQAKEEEERKRLENAKRQVTISLVNNNKRSQNSKSNPPPPKPTPQPQKMQQPQTLNLSGLKSLVEKSDPNAVPKMVTIRRVMAPFSAEPTVTITLKGSTPDKDKVLFMLKNGTETQLQPVEQENSKKKKKKKKKGNQEEYVEEVEEYEEPVYEPPPVESKKKKKGKNKAETAEYSTPPQRQISKSNVLDNPKNNKTKISKVNGQVSNVKPPSAPQKTQLQSGKKAQNSKSVPSSVKQAVPQKNVPVLKTQNQNSKKPELVSKNNNNKNIVDKKSVQSNVSKSNNSIQINGNVPKGKSSNSSSSSSSKSVSVSNSVQKVVTKSSISNEQKTKNKKNNLLNDSGRQKSQKVEVSQGKNKINEKVNQKNAKNLAEVQQKLQAQRLRNVEIIPANEKKDKKVKSNKTPMDDVEINWRGPPERSDRGKVVINTPSYRLSEVLNSIAPSPPPREEINLENLRLPPGITITKIEGPIAKPVKPAIQPTHVPKPAPPIVMATPTLKPNPPPGNVIVVDTGRLKEVMKENSQMMAPQPTSKSKKKKKKNKQQPENIAPTIEVPLNQARFGTKVPKNCAPLNRGGMTMLSGMDTRKMVPLENQQATIIKTSDNMVTIRSPALQQAMNIQAYQSNYKPTINGYTSMGMFNEEVNRINDKMGNLKLGSEDRLTRQMRNLNLKDNNRANEIFAQAMAAASQNGQVNGKKKKKKKKQKSGDEREVEPVESVFQPKDIDLENGDIDDDERELEAFKRFCFQSVPPERKNKVKVNLNIKDIVLKKKSSAIGCS